MSGLEAFQFLRPHWLWLLPLPWLLIWWLRSAPARSGWAAVVDAHLLRALRGGAATNEAKSSRSWLAWWSMLGLIAMAGPSWRLAPQPLESAQAGLVIVLDLSQGILAADEKPSRLLQARFRLLDLLRHRSEGQTALVGYAGEAFTVSPLTDDQATLEALLAGLDPSVMPIDGQRLERALALSGELLASSGIGKGEVLVVSYSADAAAASRAAGLQDEGHRVSVLPLGNPDGAPIPMQGGGFVRDARGEVVMSRSDPAALQALAQAGGGAVLPLNLPAESLARALFRDASDTAQRAAQEAQVRHDEGPWLVLLMLVAAAWKLRAGSVLLVVFLLQPEPASAWSWRDAWMRDDQQAHQAFEEGDFAAAEQLATDPLLRGSAAYRAGEFERAAETFERGSGQAEAEYNRGNALARAGRLEQALQAYDAALAQNPTLEDAAYNRDIVRQALEQQKSQQESEQNDSNEGQKDDSPADKDKPQDPSGEPGSEQDDSEQSQPSEQDPEQQANSEAEGESDQRDGDAEQNADSQAEQSAQDSGQDLDEEQARAAHRQAMEQALQEERDAPEGESSSPAAEMQDPEMLEKAQATDQWLRRIPDDPSGLLRRKFALEYRKRLQEEQR